MLQVRRIPAFEDNYIWLLQDGSSRNCAVVDPGDEEPVLDLLNAEQLQLTTVLITHKHYDHVGGVEGLKDRFPQAVVYGPGNESIRQVEQVVNEGERLKLPGLELEFDVLSVPGHTEGHLAYYGHGALFCGDTLFAGGCGRVFTGTFAQLANSLGRIADLPADTLVYCAHEYTEANLGFAAWVEPQSAAVEQRIKEVGELRRQQQATVPSNLAVERQTNPFLRLDQPSVITAAESWAGQRLDDATAVFTALRQWKDRDYD